MQYCRQEQNENYNSINKLSESNKNCFPSYNPNNFPNQPNGLYFNSFDGGPLNQYSVSTLSPDFHKPLLGGNDMSSLSVKNGNVMNNFNVNQPFMRVKDMQNMVKSNNFSSFKGKDRDPMCGSFSYLASKNFHSKKGLIAQVVKIIIVICVSVA